MLRGSLVEEPGTPGKERPHVTLRDSTIVNGRQLTAGADAYVRVYATEEQASAKIEEWLQMIEESDQESAEEEEPEPISSDSDDDSLAFVDVNESDFGDISDQEWPEESSAELATSLDQDLLRVSRRMGGPSVPPWPKGRVKNVNKYHPGMPLPHDATVFLPCLTRHHH